VEVLSEIYRRSHSLKGSSSMMGITTITKICEKINNEANPNVLDISLESLKLSLEKSTDELEANIQTIENKRIDIK